MRLVWNVFWCSTVINAYDIGCIYPEQMLEPFAARAKIIGFTGVYSGDTGLETPVAVHQGQAFSLCDVNCLSHHDGKTLNGITMERPLIVVPEFGHNSWSRMMCIAQCYAILFEQEGNSEALETIADTWKLNVAHVFFMQQGPKFKDAISYYDPFVKKASENGILDVAAIVLANLCVSYIMTNQNELAEKIMKKIEDEEDRAASVDPSRRIFHSCIVNIVIGTLYCEKRNFEFGISRICKSLEPYDKKLGPDTWFYTKRCLLAMAVNISKQMLVIEDETGRVVLNFLREIEFHGKGITASLSTIDGKDNGIAEVDISSESRQLRLLFMKLLD